VSGKGSGMKMAELRKADAGNRSELAALNVAACQREFVADNDHYLKLAESCECWSAFGIYDEDRPVGFCMYGRDPKDGQLWISQLMIDSAHQSKGYGRKALLLMLELIRSDADAMCVYLSFEPWNEWAKALYESVGFFPDGRMEEEDVIYRLDVR
jgi:diamine N-acetyltransferase